MKRYSPDRVAAFSTLILATTFVLLLGCSSKEGPYAREERLMKFAHESLPPGATNVKDLDAEAGTESRASASCHWYQFDLLVEGKTHHFLFHHEYANGNTCIDITEK